MSIKKLIDNQTIIIDDHKRGSGEVKNWNDSANDVHIDKSTNLRIDGRYQKVRIRIPINSERPVKIENSRNESIDSIPKKIIKEIKEAFEDKETRDRFIKDLIDTLRNFGEILENEERVRQTLERLSKHFDLKWTTEKITSYINNTLQTYTEIYNDETGNEFFFYCK